MKPFNKKSAVLIYIILVGFVAAIATLFLTTAENFRPDVNFVGESALSIYNNENNVFSELTFIQSAAYYSLQEALDKLPAKLTKCSKYGAYAIWISAGNCFPSKQELDQSLKKEFQESFKARLEKNKDLNIKAENYEYSIINDDHLKFLGISLNSINYDLVLKTQLAKITNPVETYQTPLLTIGTGSSSERLFEFSCSARDKNGICQLRAQALQQLNLAKKYAQEQGYELIINDAYRTKEGQEKLCGRLVNGKCNNRNAAPAGKSSHQTGGAVDVKLVINGNRNACGTLDVRDKPRLDDYRDSKYPRGIEIHNCRQELKKIMEPAQFVNLQSEWWHWEYGTELWAQQKSTQIAKVDPLYKIT